MIPSYSPTFNRWERKKKVKEKREKKESSMENVVDTLKKNTIVAIKKIVCLTISSYYLLQGPHEVI